MHYLITGCAGFIGYHLCKKILEKNKIAKIYGVDNINDYYDINIKLERLKDLRKYKNFEFKKIDIKNYEKINSYLKSKKIVYLVNLAAQAGVRHSIDNPHDYIDSNIVGFINILEGCRKQNIENFIFASSSSVYGNNREAPFSVTDRVDNPISLYAATKKSNELIAYTYSHLYKIPTIGLRFFTVYGPWGRPDMAYYKFSEKIISNNSISLYNNGKMKRDFTYIDDIIDGIMLCLNKKYEFEIFNLGNGNTEELLDMVNILENYLNKKAITHFKDMQPGDVKMTSADINKTSKMIGYSPRTNLDEGLMKFVDWYTNYINKG